MTKAKSTGKMSFPNPLAGLNLGGGIDTYLRDTREETSADSAPDGVPGAQTPLDAIETSSGKSGVVIKLNTRRKKNAQEDEIVSTVTKGVPEGFQRYSFVVKQESLDKVRRKAYWERQKIAAILNDALDKYLEDQKQYKTVPEGAKVS